MNCVPCNRNNVLNKKNFLSIRGLVIPARVEKLRLQQQQSLKMGRVNFWRSLASGLAELTQMNSLLQQTEETLFLNLEPKDVNRSKPLQDSQ